MDITAAAVATLISSGIATTVSLLISRANNKTNNLKSLDDQLDNILKISIQYPYLEDPKFAAAWNNNKASEQEEYLRYDIYCNLVFNYMERVCKYYKFDEQEIQNKINIKEWIRVHKNCWSDPSSPYENADGYCKEFKKLITNFIK